MIARRIVLGLAGAWLAGSLAAAPAAAAGVTAGFQQPFLQVAPGDTFQVQIVVPVAGDPFNAFDAPIRFDPAQLTFVPTSPLANQRGALMTSACSNTFHLFNARPDSLQITLSLLCNQVFVIGPGVVYQVRFRAPLTPGITTLTLGPSTAFYNAGFKVLPLVKTGMTVQIGDPVPPDVAVLTPNGGESWTVGTSHDITWTATDASGVASVDLDYSADGGGSWTPIATGEPNDGVFAWTVPPTPSANALVRVTAYDPASNSASDTSDAVFTIADVVDVPTAGAPAAVRLLAPRPNPARGGAGTLAFELPAADDVRLEALDAQGRRVATLAAGRFAAGRHSLPARFAAPPGVYRVRLVTGAGAIAERGWTLLR